MDLVFTIVLPVTLGFIMFALGLGLTIDDFRNIAARPKALAVGFFAQLVIVPTAAYIMVITFRLPPELAVGMMILSFCPGGPTTNMLTRLGLGDVALSVSLTGFLSIISVITLPVLTAFFANLFMGLDAPPISVAQLVMTLLVITFVPICLGMFIRTRQSDPDRLERRMLRIAGVLFVIIVLGALAANWTLFIASLPVLGPSALTLIAVLLVAGLILARLFSLNHAQTTSICVDTGIQNATLGITVGLVLAGNVIGSPFTLPAAVYGILMYFLAVPFVLWRRRSAASNPV